jgi:hypothetical protein
MSKNSGEINLDLLRKMMGEDSDSAENTAVILLGEIIKNQYKPKQEEEDKTSFITTIIDSSVGVISLVITIIAMVVTAYIGIVRPLDNTSGMATRNEKSISELKKEVKENQSDVGRLKVKVENHYKEIDGKLLDVHKDISTLRALDSSSTSRLLGQIMGNEDDVTVLFDEVEELWRELATVLDKEKADKILERIRTNGNVRRGKRQYGF